MTEFTEHAGERLLHEVTVGLVANARAKERRDVPLQMHEIELQYQFEISGVAATPPSFTTLTVAFDHPFHYAPGQRDSSLQRPHFNFGSETSPAVGIHATVTQWYTDADNGAVTGADVAVGAAGAGAFAGAVHLTFQGWAALDEPEDTNLQS